MNKPIRPSILCTLGLLLAASLSNAYAAAGNAEHGADVFDGQCTECHSLKAGKNKKGPSLFASVGRKAGSITDYVYSDAMRASGITWTPDKMEAYVNAPKTVVPGGKMKFDSKLTPQESADLLAFLSTQH